MNTTAKHDQTQHRTPLQGKHAQHHHAGSDALSGLQTDELGKEIYQQKFVVFCPSEASLGYATSFKMQHRPQGLLDRTVQ
eukprot:628558-Pyramimonas_sp.AAC.1